jgi:hypothetical protein
MVKSLCLFFKLRAYWGSGGIALRYATDMSVAPFGHKILLV